MNTDCSVGNKVYAYVGVPWNRVGTARAPSPCSPCWDPTHFLSPSWRCFPIGFRRSSPVNQCSVVVSVLSQFEGTGSPALHLRRVCTVLKPSPQASSKAPFYSKRRQWVCSIRNSSIISTSVGIARGGVWDPKVCVPSPPLSFPSPGKTAPHHPLGDGHQATVPHPPLGNCTTTVHAHLQAQKLQHKTKELSIGCVQRAANVQRPTP